MDQLLQPHQLLRRPLSLGVVEGKGKRARARGHSHREDSRPLAIGTRLSLLGALLGCRLEVECCRRRGSHLQQPLTNFTQVLLTPTTRHVVYPSESLARVVRIWGDAPHTGRTRNDVGVSVRTRYLRIGQRPNLAEGSPQVASEGPLRLALKRLPTTPATLPQTHKTSRVQHREEPARVAANPHWHATTSPLVDPLLPSRPAQSDAAKSEDSLRPRALYVPHDGGSTTVLYFYSIRGIIAC